MSHKVIKPSELKLLLDQGRVVLIDVREPVEFREERIPGALNIPLSSFSLESLKPFEGKAIVAHCQSGNRSRQGVHKVSDQATSVDIKDLEGGITGWKKAGLPTQSERRGASLPLMRQVQLIIGLCVLVGTLLSYFVSLAFLIIPLIMGAGLTVAGLTGWCGLAKLVSMMPWNR